MSDHPIDPFIDPRRGDAPNDDTWGDDDSVDIAPTEQNRVGDAETLLRRAVDIVATAPTMPLSSSPRIDRDEMVELLGEALTRLPEELRQARYMLRERDEFIARTRREAAEIVEAAQRSAPVAGEPDRTVTPTGHAANDLHQHRSCDSGRPRGARRPSRSGTER